ncbi:MAG: hypothetical protein ACREXY_00070 [Gammaproteobacteria bacterium]
MSNNKIELTYRLPVSTVTVDGARTTITNKYTKPKKAVAYTSQVAIQIEADPKTLHLLRLPDPDDSTSSCTVEVASDGRLASTQAGIDDKSQDRIRALLKSGLAAAGTVAPLAAAALFAPASIPAAGVMALASLGLPLSQAGESKRSLLLFGHEDGNPLSISDVLGEDYVDDETEIEKEERLRKRLPSLNDLGIEDDYRRADEHAATVLANLRWSNIQLRVAIAGAGYAYVDEPQSLSKRLQALTKARDAMRSELARAEEAYANWIAGNSETDVEAFHHVFRLEQLPSTATLKRMASNGHEGDDIPSWWRLLTQLHCAISRDFEDKDPEELNADIPLGIPDSQEAVVYRIPRLATVTHWSVKPNADQDPHDPATEWELTEVLRERRKIVVVQGTESSIPLRPTKGIRNRPLGDSDTGLTFDTDGILSKVSTKRTDPSLERAKTLAELPEDIKGGISAGKAMLEPFTTENETKRLKAQTDLIDAQKALKKAQAPSSDDPLSDLKADVEKAELQARRARANAIVSDPTRSLVVVTVTPEIDDEGNEV